MAATNTVIVANTSDKTRLLTLLESLDIQPRSVSCLRGPLNRLLCCCFSTAEAVQLVAALRDSPVFQDCKVFYGAHYIPPEETSLLGQAADPGKLMPPKPEKNFLLSPPGDPPIGWVQTTETNPHVHDLTALVLSPFSLDNDNESQGELGHHLETLEQAQEKSQLEARDLHLHFGDDLPEIRIHHSDHPSDGDDSEDQRIPRTPVPVRLHGLPKTSLPPR